MYIFTFIIQGELLVILFTLLCGGNKGIFVFYYSTLRRGLGWVVMMIK